MLKRNRVNIMILVSMGVFVLNKVSPLIFEKGSDICKYVWFGTDSILVLCLILVAYLTKYKGQNRKVFYQNIIMGGLVATMNMGDSFINYGNYNLFEWGFVVLCISGIIINTTIDEVRTRH